MTDLIDDGANENGFDPKAMFTETLRALQEVHNADVFFLSGTINYPTADLLTQTAQFRSNHRQNAILILTTAGGDPHAAYRIARYFKRRYDIFTVFILGYCKSAGTLLALGADAIVMTDFGELGPIDVQAIKPDQIASMSSGLDIVQALNKITSQGFAMYEQYYLLITERSGGNITTKTAGEIATNLTIGLLAPITSQIDPLHLGELDRANAIGRKYGSTLTNGKKLTAVNRLLLEYPSHGHVIDIVEAQELLGSDMVRGPTELEDSFALLLEMNYEGVRYPPPRDSTVICLTEDTDEEEPSDEEADKSQVGVRDEHTDGPIEAVDRGHDKNITESGPQRRQSSKGRGARDRKGEATPELEEFDKQDSDNPLVPDKVDLEE